VASLVGTQDAANIANTAVPSIHALRALLVAHEREVDTGSSGWRPAVDILHEVKEDRDRCATADSVLVVSSPSAE
jgi:hypothetical protein